MRAVGAPNLVLDVVGKHPLALRDEGFDNRALVRHVLDLGEEG